MDAPNRRLVYHIHHNSPNNTVLLSWGIPIYEGGCGPSIDETHSGVRGRAMMCPLVPLGRCETGQPPIQSFTPLFEDHQYDARTGGATSVALPNQARKQGDERYGACRVRDSEGSCRITGSL